MNNDLKIKRLSLLLKLNTGVVSITRLTEISMIPMWGLGVAVFLVKNEPCTTQSDAYKILAVTVATTLKILPILGNSIYIL